MNCKDLRYPSKEVDMKCRVCGTWFATNAVTNCCSECDRFIMKGRTELRNRHIADHATYDNMSRNLKLGLISQDTFDLYYDVWATSAHRFFLGQSDIKEAMERLVERFSNG